MCKRGSPEGAALWQRFQGLSPSACKRESPEGVHPSGRKYGGCASINHSSFLSPFLLGSGPGGWSEPQSRRSPNRGTPEGVVAPWQGPEGVPARLQAGESRGGAPLWQEVWRMCLHKPLLFSFPLPLRKGARGMVRATIEAKPRIAGLQRGAAPRHPLSPPEATESSAPARDGTP